MKGMSQTDSYSSTNEIKNNEHDKANSNLLHSKRIRNPVVNYQYPKPPVYNSKTEEQMVKYALKLSKKEFENKAKFGEKNPRKIQKFEEIPNSPTYEANEYDFLDFSKYLENICQNQKVDSGVFKIKPPEKWIANYKKSYINIIDEMLKKDTSKKIDYRIQRPNCFQSAVVSKL